MPFKTPTTGPSPDWSSGKWFRGIMAGIIILLTGSILGYTFQQLGGLAKRDEMQSKRLDTQEKQIGVMEEQLKGIERLINERTQLLESKLDNLRMLIEERTK